MAITANSEPKKTIKSARDNMPSANIRISKTSQPAPLGKQKQPFKLKGRQFAKNGILFGVTTTPVVNFCGRSFPGNVSSIM